MIAFANNFSINIVDSFSMKVSTFLLFNFSWVYLVSNWTTTINYLFIKCCYAVLIFNFIQISIDNGIYLNQEKLDRLFQFLGKNLHSPSHYLFLLDYVLNISIFYVGKFGVMWF